MHSYVTSKNVKWCHLIWPTLYTDVHLLTYLQHSIAIGIVSHTV